MPLKNKNETPGPKPAAAEGRKVAVVRFSALGDVALVIPVLYNACRSNPDTEFVMVTRRAFAPLFVNPPANLTVRGIDLRRDYVGIAGMNRLAAELRGHTLVDLHSVLRTWMLAARTRLQGARVVVFDKCRAAKRRLVKEGAAACRDTITPVTERYADAFRDAGLQLTHPFRGLYASTPADPALYASLHAPKAPGEHWIGVAPFAAHPGKIYPIELMYKAVHAMAAENPLARVFLFGGGKEEEAILRSIMAESTPGKVFCVAGSKIGFAGELALMNALDVMVCMDSGNMHMAAVAGTRTVSVWGATHPAAGFEPWTPVGAPKDYHRSVQVHMDCRPCSVFGNKPCRLQRGGVPPCMSQIDPLTITFAALDINKKLLI